MMLDELRTNLVTLMCVRAGLNPWHGREVDRLPAEDLAALERGRPTHVNAEELDATRQHLTRRFLDEIRLHDPQRASRLRAPFEELSEPVR